MAYRNLSWSDRAIVLIGTCGGTGCIGLPAGTTGSFLGTLLYPLTFRGMAIMPFFLIYAICVLGSIWVLSHCERIFHEKDPRKANLDELVAMPLCFWPAEIFISKFSQPSINFYLWLFLGFVIFRVFDILKPLGIRRLECLPGGLGIVMDDLAAAVATSGCLILLQFLL